MTPEAIEQIKAATRAVTATRTAAVRRASTRSSLPPRPNLRPLFPGRPDRPAGALRGGARAGRPQPRTRWSALREPLRDLGAQHVHWGARPEDYVTAREALVAAIGALSPSWNATLEAALARRRHRHHRPDARRRGGPHCARGRANWRSGSPGDPKRTNDETYQHARAGPLCQSHRHRDRILRFLHLRDGGRTRLSEAVLSRVRSRRGDAGVAGDICDRLLRATDRVGGVRALRRSRRAQDDARRCAADDGPVDRVDRFAADLRVDRRGRAALARAVPVRAGARAGRRVGRRRAAGGRERAARETRVVRHVSRNSARRSASSVPLASSSGCRPG